MVISTFGYYCKISKNTEKYWAFSIWYSITHGTVFQHIVQYSCLLKNLSSVTMNHCHHPKCLFFKLFLQEIQLEKANSKNFTLISKTKESSKMTRGEK